MAHSVLLIFLASCGSSPIKRLTDLSSIMLTDLKTRWFSSTVEMRLLSFSGSEKRYQEESNSGNVMKAKPNMKVTFLGQEFEGFTVGASIMTCWLAIAGSSKANTLGDEEIDKKRIATKVTSEGSEFMGLSSIFRCSRDLVVFKGEGKEGLCGFGCGHDIMMLDLKKSEERRKFEAVDWTSL